MFTIIITYQGNEVGRLGGKFVRQLLVIGNKVSNVDITVVLLY